ncbi:hypothetical protein JCM10212_004539 [Sporobolomyces blumeae]
MPAPRAARLASRKSVIPDPDLYNDLSDDSDAGPSTRTLSSQQQQQTTSASTSAKALATKKKPPPPARGSTTVAGGKRRSTRLSTESVEPEPPARHDKAASRAASDRKRAGEPIERPSGRHLNAGKRKRVDKEPAVEAVDEKDEDEAQEVDGRDEPSRSASNAPSGKGTAKRTKANHAARDETGSGEDAAPSQTSQAAPPRRTFVPRAAASQTARAKKPITQHSTVLEGSDEEPATFHYTTNPPTPHAAGQSKRAAGKAKQNPKGKQTAREDEETTPDDSPAYPPVASTSRAILTPPRPETSTAITTAETPVQVKNIAFRQGGVGTPGTVGRSARRTSARGSAGRGSNIGGGFEAVPHPQVADDKLYRSTDADEPLAKRLRSIISWASQRTRDRVFAAGKSRSEEALDKDERFAKGIVDDFIADVCNLRVDTSIPYDEEEQDPASLPPHPQNISNAAKMKELAENYAAIDREQTLRQSLEPVYSAFFERRSAAHASSFDSPLAKATDILTLAASFDLTRKGPTSMDEAVEMGRVLLGESERRKAEQEEKEQAKKKDRRKSRVKEEGDDERPKDPVILRVKDTLSSTARLRHLVHKLASFTRVASSYISHRSAETHSALTLHSRLGLESSASTADRDRDSTTLSGTRGGATGAAASSKRDGGAGLATVGLVSSSASAPATATSRSGLDPMDLLRAIATADSKR